MLAFLDVSETHDVSSPRRRTIGVRWALKKLARKSLAAAAWLSGALLLRRLGRGRVRVLTYHRFGDATRDPFCVREADFERQMEWLSRSGLAVSLSDLDEFLAGRRTLPRDAVVVTVDDGCPCLFSRALPIAKRHGIPLVAFVPAGEVTSVRGRAPLDSPDARVTSDELAALAAEGIVIGSHACTHRSLGRLAVDAVRSEAEQSRTALERVTGKPVTAFAYPFGTRADYNATTTEILRAAGYRFAFTSQHGAIAAGDDPLELPRIKVEGGEGLWMFRAIVHGGLDGWRVIDRFLWRVQAAR